MEQYFTEEQKFIRAQKRLQQIKGFYSHLLMYCIIIPVIIFMNLNFQPNFHWFWFSVIGWGLGLFFHWLRVFGFRLIGLGISWEEKKIKQYMNE